MPTNTGAQATESILKLTVDYQKAIQDIGGYLTEIKKLKAEQKDLDKAFAAGALTEKAYGEAMATNKATTTQLNTEMKALTNEVKKKMEADRAEQKQIDINTASYNKLSQTYKEMKQRINEMSQAEREQNKAYIDQSKKVYERMKQLQAETGKMQLNVGNYQQAITMAITGNSRFASSLMGLAGGATNASSALGIVNQNVMALGQTVTTLMTNPVFLAIMGVAAVGTAFKFWRDYNEGIAEANRLTKQFTGESGEALNSIRSSVQAIADTFGKDFKETLQAVDTLVSQFGIDWKEASDLVAEGFSAGADVNGDFLANIKQYGPALKDAGLSAEELVAVIQQTRSGVFSKEGLDMITKASKALRDMSNSTAESLRGIGINADELKDKLANGSITMMQAIQQVSEHLKGVSTNSQEAGAVINDVFGKKGVAAGQEQAKALADLEMSLDSLIDKEGEYGTTLNKIYEVQEELNKVTFALFGTEGWDEMKKKAELFGKSLLLYVLTGIYKCYNGFVDLWNLIKMISNGISQFFVASLATAWAAMKQFANLVGDSLTSLGDSMKGFGTIIEGVFTFSTEKIEAGWNKLTSGLKGAWQSAVINFKTFGSQAAANFSTGWNNTLATNMTEYAALPESVGGVGGSSSVTTPGGGGGGSTSSKPKSGKTGTTKTVSATDKAEKEREKQRRAEEAAAKAELALRQKVIQSRLALIKKGTQEEMQLRLEALEQERLLAIERIEQENKDVENQALVQELILNTNKDYLNKRKAIYDEFEKSEQERMEQAVANMFTERVMAAANNSLEQERIKLEQLQYMRDNARQKDGETIEAFNARKLQLEQEYLDAKAELTSKEIEVEQAKFDALETIAGGIGKVFSAMGEKNKDFAQLSKVLALAEIAINTGKAIAAGVAQAQSMPFPANIAAIATTVATILANIATAISTVNSAKFAKGGLITGPGTGTSDSINARVSNGESIMTASATSLFSPLLSALNQLGGGVPIVQTGVQTQLGEDMLAAAVAKGYAMAPSPVVSVREINDVENRVKVIENMATS